MKKVTAFFAYTSRNQENTEAITTAIGNINLCSNPDEFEIIKWQDLSRGGNMIISEICATIDKSDLFMCDITFLNRNVLFELGYAIAKKKRIWITMNTSYSSQKDNFKKFDLLSPYYYSPYVNSHDIQQNFFREEPNNYLDQSIFSELIKISTQNQINNPTLFYLKTKQNTEASRRLSAEIQKQEASLKISDPNESSQTLQWYFNTILYSQGVILHFIDDQRDDNYLLNKKYSLLAGISYGLGIPTLMLAHAPFNSPLDYQHILQTHNTAKQCIVITRDWFENNKNLILPKNSLNNTNVEDIRRETELLRMQLGEYTAENENENQINEYFVETVAFKQALDSKPYRFFVGRKGTGKTANLYQIKAYKQQDTRNHVCVIKPIDYELSDIITLIKKVKEQSHPGYLLESLWKFLIISELAVSYYNTLNKRPAYLDFSPDELSFINYMKDNDDVFFTDFTIRLESAVKRLLEISDTTMTATEHRLKISELLHKKLLSEIQKKLFCLFNQTNEIVILIDNLDKAWGDYNELGELSNFLFGLLGAGQEISGLLAKSNNSKASLIVFLRQDIYNYIKQQHTREVDKLRPIMIDWTDKVLLLRVIEERFVYFSKTSINPEETWEIYFIDKVNGISTKDYIYDHIIPRPRDLIFFCKEALFNAINRNHLIIEADDILNAEKKYSSHAFDSLVTELDTLKKGMMDLLYEFAGSNEIVTKSDIEILVQLSGLQDIDIEEIIDLLSIYTFLGIEVDEEEFSFLYSDLNSRVSLTRARRHSRNNGPRRYKINQAFHAFLEIK